MCDLVQELTGDRLAGLAPGSIDFRCPQHVAEHQRLGIEINRRIGYARVGAGSGGHGPVGEGARRVRFPHQVDMAVTVVVAECGELPTERLRVRDGGAA